MPNEDSFSDQVHDALKHIYDYPYLEAHPLALRFWPEAQRRGPVRAHRLSRLLLESIEELSPPGQPSKEPSRSRAYSVLVARFVDERPLGEVMRELSVSRRQFFREQQRATAILAALLQEKLSAQPDPASGSRALLAAEAGRVLAQPEVVYLTEVIDSALGVVRPLARQQSVALEWEAADDGLPVYGSRTLLRQVFLKALNALITLPCVECVNLTSFREGQSARVDLVAALGGTERRPHRRPEPRTPDFTAVCRLVEMAGGHMCETRSHSNAFACRLTFPLGSERVLLIVEDNEAVIHAFQRYVRGHDYQVVGAASGLEALRLARELHPIAITLDVLMPDLDGWEILHALKNEPSTCRIPVVICSALDDAELARSLGAQAYLAKPVSQAEFLATLSSVVPGSDGPKGGPKRNEWNADRV